MSLRISIFLFVASCFLLDGRAWAHQSSSSYSEVRYGETADSLRYQVRIDTGDLYEALALEEDRDATDEEIMGGRDQLLAYLHKRIRLRVPEQTCRIYAEQVRVVREARRFAEVSWGLLCDRDIEKWELQYDLFFELDKMHQGFLRSPEGMSQFSERRRIYRGVRGDQESALFSFFSSGVHHVLSGLDHLFFVITFLLALPFWAASSSSKQGGAKDQFLPDLFFSARRALILASAFTLGHSLTLALAALGWINLSSRLVESAIALSIVYLSVETVWKTSRDGDEPTRTWLLCALFGLVHGLGFAFMLRPLLEGSEVLTPLLLFNLGVEVAQVLVVCVTLPLLALLCAALGGRRYQRLVLFPVALAIAVTGIYWFAERIQG